MLIAESIRSDGLAIISAAKAAYPKTGSLPERPGLRSVTAHEAERIRHKIGVELALAEYDLSTGRIFQASHRVVLARTLLGRKGERYLT